MAGSKMAAILYNQTVVVHWGHFTGQLAQGWPWLPLTFSSKRLPMAAMGKR